MLSKVLDARFAAVSSSGERARVGSNAAAAGRNTLPTTALSVASAYTTRLGAPANTAAAAPATVTTRSRSEASITRSRRNRSLIDAASGATTAAADRRTKTKIPTAVAPP